MVEALPTLSQDFRDFLVEAKTEHGYGQPGANVEPGENGGKRLVYENSVFSYVDEFVGGAPYLGHESVAVLQPDQRLHAVWGMSYFETHRDAELPESELGGVFAEVLSRPDETMPIRGPRKWEGDGLRYEFHLVDRTSTLEWFSAKEVVYGKGRKLYVARFVGGLANRDPELEATNPVWLAATGKDGEEK